MKKAFAYLRCSGLSQDRSDTWERQEEVIASYAKAHRMNVVASYRDTGVSGTTEGGDRRGLTDLLLAIDANGIRTVLVERADRLARDLIVSEMILRQFHERGVEVIEAASGQPLGISTDPSRNLIRQVLSAVAEFQKTELVLRLRSGKARARREGRLADGQAPYGARPEEVEPAQRILKMRAKGQTLQAIADTLNAEQVPTRRGAQWSRSLVLKVVKRGPVSIIDPQAK